MNNKHPNIIYILADDMGYGDLSCLNEESKIHTQHLDELAAGGMVFTDAHASSAVCTPSRYSIMTGRYNWRSALKQGVTWGYSKPLLEAGRTTVASYLQGQGYHTACIGKWHLGLGWVFHEERPADALDDIDYTKAIADGPTTSGFDYYFGIPASLDMQPYVYVENDRVTAIPDRIIPGRDDKEMWREGPIAPDFAHEEVLPKLTEKAVAYVEERAASDQPFFLYYPLPAPHTPILPTAEFQGKSGTNEYGDFCLQVDDLIGQLMAVLEKHGLTENTIFVFTSDNGCSPRADFDELAAVGHRPSYHFRGHKADIYEGGHRIPLVVRWPQTIAAGTASHETVCLVDLIATCADVVGDVLPANVGEDSVSNLPAWRGESIPTSLREATVHSSVNGSLAIRQGQWKLEMCPGSGGWSYPKPGVETDGLPPLQLYDLATDIGETANVAADHPDIVESLTDLLTRYITQGRSTPGEPQQNEGGSHWTQLWWMAQE